MNSKDDYNDQAISQTNAARLAAAKAGAEALAEAADALGAIHKLEIKSVNALRLAGQQFNVCSGRAQLQFTLAGLDFCRKQIVPHLPPGAGIGHVKLAVHLAGILKKPISKVEELRVVKNEVQQMLAVFGVADAPRRKELQSAHARNYYAEFVDKLAGLRLILKKIEETDPLESWDRPRLEALLEDLAPLKKIIARVERHFQNPVNPAPDE